MRNASYAYTGMLPDLDAGRTTLAAIANSVLGTAPPASAPAARSTFFAGLYRTILRREPDSGGLAYFTSGLGNTASSY